MTKKKPNKLSVIWEEDGKSHNKIIDIPQNSGEYLYITAQQDRDETENFLTPFKAERSNLNASRLIELYKMKKLIKKYRKGFQWVEIFENLYENKEEWKYSRYECPYLLIITSKGKSQFYYIFEKNPDFDLIKAEGFEELPLVKRDEADGVEIEDSIFDDTLPGNSIALLNRIKDLLAENQTNSINNAKHDLRIRKAMWLLNEMYRPLHNPEEWKTLKKLSQK